MFSQGKYLVSCIYNSSRTLIFSYKGFCFLHVFLKNPVVGPLTLSDSSAWLLMIGTSPPPGQPFTPGPGTKIPLSMKANPHNADNSLFRKVSSKPIFTYSTTGIRPDLASFHPESALFRPGCVDLRISRERRDILCTPPRKPLIFLPGRKSSG